MYAVGPEPALNVYVTGKWHEVVQMPMDPSPFVLPSLSQPTPVVMRTSL